MLTNSWQALMLGLMWSVMADVNDGWYAIGANVMSAVVLAIAIVWITADMLTTPNPARRRGERCE